MKIIAFAGLAGSGKSTLSKQLARLYSAKILSFAYPLREELVSAGFPRDQVYTKPTLPHIRALLQAWGYSRRCENPDYWADKMWLDLENALVLGANGPGIVAIDDLRYDNEASMLTDFECEMGVPVRFVQVHNSWNKPDLPDHESERGLGGFYGFHRIYVNEKDNWNAMHAFLRDVVEGMDGSERTDHLARVDEQGELDFGEGFSYAGSLEDWGV